MREHEGLKCLSSHKQTAMWEIPLRLWTDSHASRASKLLIFLAEIQNPLHCSILYHLLLCSLYYFDFFYMQKLSEEMEALSIPICWRTSSKKAANQSYLNFKKSVSLSNNCSFFRAFVINSSSESLLYSIKQNQTLLQ